MNRRAFIALGAAGTLGWSAPRSFGAQAAPQNDDVPYGETRLGVSSDDRDGTLYVPKKYKPGVPMPLLMMLHGFAGFGTGVRYTFPLAEEFGVIVIAPDSRDITWGQSAPGFDADVRYLGAASR